MQEPFTHRNRWTILAVLCVAVFTILVDTNIVNVAIPTLVTELDASTRDMLWIVDAYNLVFAAVVLAAGSLADRYGRKPALLVGLTVFGVATTVGAFLDTSAELTVARGVMGLGAGIIFPTTLSIISNVFSDRKERAQAIGIWGATTGLAIASSPILGGFLLEHFWWGSVFLAMTPLAVIGFVATALVIPNSRDPETPPLDFGGLALSIAGLGLTVYTIIEAPERGWSSSATLREFAVAGLLLAAFVWWERRHPHPMLDVSLFRNLRFSAASGSVTVAFFCLFGFIFLVTQYFQFLRGYSPLESGVRLIPVALAVGSSSILGTALAVRLGNKVVVATGLGLLAIGYFWISQLETATSYLEIVGQMIVLGTGMGFTSAPATEAIMGVVPPEKAGVGSAVNDATRELGGTLGVAVLGSVFASLYAGAFDGTSVQLPPAAAEAVRDGIGPAQAVAAEVAAQAGRGPADQLLAVAAQGFYDGFHTATRVAAVIALGGCAFALRFLPARPPTPPSGEHDLELAGATAGTR
jgi:EmrB/QacA subfamily drug resistance transporter